ncbi:MAG: tRNA uridine-5-carboxymethylaminomethyl(34) synthesis GTPase MnmE [Candidatus Omnitrophica bacterium]|nr:tRNA uridine-5-carboxymethylaminomethyl(34) synthesis GTPase MnmE [Candidatus Omnitrophota bacterium]
MYQYKGFEETIAAIATPAGTGGVAIVRLSGEKSVRILERVFVSDGGKSPSEWVTHVLHYGRITGLGGEAVDDVLAVVMRAPKSYTGEDVVEVHCHGGSTVSKSVLTCCLENGARLALPGEFTKRAFLNGRMDLAQAEAVLDVISARNEAFLRAGRAQLDGILSQELNAAREALMAVYTQIEALINFPEDDTQDRQEEPLAMSLAREAARLEGLLDTAAVGRVMKEGARIVICGRPNVGKSSLLNALLKAPRAIVTDVAGTTRDVLEEQIMLGGIPVNLMDTAGILEPRDKVEAEAVRRTRASLKSADIVLFVLDGSVPLSSEDRMIFDGIRNPHICVVVNKSDMSPAFQDDALQGWNGGRGFLRVSADTGENIPGLEARIRAIVLDGRDIDPHGAVLTNLRHVEALRRALAALQRSGESVVQQYSLEFMVEDIKLAVNELDAITGRNIDADLLEQIFSKFCIGK